MSSTLTPALLKSSHLPRVQKGSAVHGGQEGELIANSSVDVTTHDGDVSFWDLGQVLLEENHDHIVSVEWM
jgi:hypothetical protein